MAASRSACPRPIGDEMYSARRRRASERVHVRVAGRPSCRASFQGPDEVADDQVRQDRVAARDHVVGALDDDERRAGQLGEALRPRDAAGSGPRCRGRGPSGSARPDRSPRSPARSIVKVASPSAIIASTEPSSAQPTASSIALVECGSDVIVSKKNRANPGVVAPPVVAVDLGPALVGRQLVVERPLDPVRMRRRQPRHAERERHDAQDALRVLRRRTGCSARRRRRTGRRGPPGACRSRPGRPRGRRVSRSLPYAVGHDRAIGPAVAAAVVGDDPVRPAQERDLGLPLARVDDRRRGQQHDRRVAVAEDVVREADPVAGDRPARRRSGRRARPRIGRRPAPRGASPCSSRVAAGRPRTKSRIEQVRPRPGRGRSGGGRRRRSARGALRGSPRASARPRPTPVMASSRALDDERGQCDPRRTIAADSRPRRAGGAGSSLTMSVSASVSAPSRPRPRSAWSNGAP